MNPGESLERRVVASGQAGPAASAASNRSTSSLVVVMWVQARMQWGFQGAQPGALASQPATTSPDQGLRPAASEAHQARRWGHLQQGLIPGIRCSPCQSWPLRSRIIASRTGLPLRLQQLQGRRPANSGVQEVATSKRRASP